MSSLSLGGQVKGGFRKAGGWLIGFGWLFLVFAGMAVALTPSNYPPALGWAMLVLAALILTFTMDKWGKFFPGLLAYGVVGSLVMLWTGHAINHPEVRVSRLEAFILILFFAAAAALSHELVVGQLSKASRVAILLFVACIFWQAAMPRMMFVAAGIGLLGLAVAWMLTRSK